MFLAAFILLYRIPSKKFLSNKSHISIKLKSEISLFANRICESFPADMETANATPVHQYGEALWKLNHEFRNKQKNVRWRTPQQWFCFWTTFMVKVARETSLHWIKIVWQLYSTSVSHQSSSNFRASNSSQSIYYSASRKISKWMIIFVSHHRNLHSINYTLLLRK